MPDGVKKSFLSTLIPTNLLEEKEKFFLDTSYNPQFTYSEIIDQKKYHKYPKPNETTAQHASAIVEQTLKEIDAQHLFDQHKEVLPKAQVFERTLAFLDLHNLENECEIVTSASFIARTSVNDRTIKMRLPLSYDNHGLTGMLYHEIGTHLLRTINYEKQPFYKRKNKYGFSPYLATEEGLAILHGLIPQEIALAYKPALLYMSALESQKKSFAQMWEFLTPYITDQERRWNAVVRQKRGLEDTSLPGGYTKDCTYFTGLITVSQWLEAHNFEISDLYYGKIAVEDAGRAVELNPDFQPLLPSFYTTNPDEYAQRMHAIIAKNSLL